MTRSVIATLSFFFLVPVFLQADVLVDDFSDGYTDHQPIVGTNGWGGTGQAAWFQARPTAAGDPAFLGDRFGSLNNNAQGTSATNSWLYRSFSAVSTGTLRATMDVLYQASGSTGLNSCEIYLSDGDKTPGSDYAVGSVATVSVGKGGLRVFDENMWPITNVDLANDQWYRFQIDMDLDARIWGLQVAEWTDSTLGSFVQAVHPSMEGEVSEFEFRDASADDVGLLEFLATDNVMDDSAGRGFLIDNVVAPEPASLLLLSLFGPTLLGRRKRTGLSVKQR